MTVLLAEDEAGTRSPLRRLLSAQGYRVLDASDGPAALEVAKRHSGRIHLLLTVRRVDDDGQTHEVMFTLADLYALREAVKRIPDLRLIVIDPIGSFIGGRIHAGTASSMRASSSGRWHRLRALRSLASLIGVTGLMWLSRPWRIARLNTAFTNFR